MTERTVYVATGNAGKLRDFRAAAKAFRENGEEPGTPAITLEPLPGLAAIAPPEENADTFEGNARVKAIYYSRHAPGVMVIADDSGLEVDALAGAPGVYSARYAERAGAARDLGTDASNNQHLLMELARMLTAKGLSAPPDQSVDRSVDHRVDHRVDQRGARYRCVLAAARDGHVLATAEGCVEGRILFEPRGSSGFGYDPLFLIPELEQTMAEVDPLTRLALSHRGQALRALLARLSALL